MHSSLNEFSHLPLSSAIKASQAWQAGGGPNLWLCVYASVQQHPVIVHCTSNLQNMAACQPFQPVLLIALCTQVMHCFHPQTLTI